MKSQSNLSLNWTNNTKVKPKILFPNSLDGLKKILSTKNFICTGNQRSYGDVAVNPNFLVSMQNFNKVIKFDKKKGIIEVEGGVILSDILKLIIEHGWFFPVTPGTKYVSIGGMIANNVHGKKTSKNQIKYYIKEFKILLENKKILRCSLSSNKKIFDLTIGGFGLTGIILSAKIKLKKISSPIINQNIIAYNSYKEFFSHLKKSKKYDYYVSWVQSFNEIYFNGLSYFGSHSNNKDNLKIYFKDKKISFLNYLLLKIFTQNYYGIKILNFFHKSFKLFFYPKKTDILNYFYPQDKFTNWNKIYGNKGFIQIQFLVKKNKFKEVMGEIGNYLKENKQFSPFVVIKNYDERGKYLNFIGKGISISMDMRIDNKFSNLKFFFNKLFLKYGARINLSKDFITSHKYISRENDYKIFKKEINKLNKRGKFNSVFSKRLGI